MKLIFNTLVFVSLFFNFAIAKNIMFIPLDINYTKSDQSSLSLDIFDAFNSIVVDFNIKTKEHNESNDSLKVIQSLLPNIKYQTTISKFYAKFRKNQFSYIKKVATYYKTDILLFANMRKIKNKKFKISFYVYKKQTQKITHKNVILKFNSSTDSFINKDIKKLKQLALELLQ